MYIYFFVSARSRLKILKYKKSDSKSLSGRTWQRRVLCDAPERGRASSGWLAHSDDFWENEDEFSIVHHEQIVMETLALCWVFLTNRLQKQLSQQHTHTHTCVCVRLISLENQTHFGLWTFCLFCLYSILIFSIFDLIDICNVFLHSMMETLNLICDWTKIKELKMAFDCDWLLVPAVHSGNLVLHLC